MSNASIIICLLFDLRVLHWILSSSLKKSEDIIELDQTNLELDLAVLSLNGDRP